LAPFAVDDLALVVQDVVELQGALADIEVARLDLDLGLRDGTGHHAGLDGLLVVEAETGHETGDALRREDPDEVVLERVVEARRTRVALAAGSSAELVVDAARLVTLGPDDVEPAQPGHTVAE